MAEDYHIRMRGESNPNYRNATERTCPGCGTIFHTRNETKTYCSKSCGLTSPQAHKNRSEASKNRRKVKRLRPAPEQLGQHQLKVMKAMPLEIILKEKKVTQPRLPFTFKGHYHRKKPKKLLCVSCNRPFIKGRGSQKYCNQCGYITLACVVCEKPFTHHRSQIKTTCSELCARRQRAIRQKGEKSHRWQGGRTNEVILFRCSLEYTLWRTAVFKRDNYTCQLCFQRGAKLSAHHIKKFSEHHELALVVENGITLCWPCHANIKNKEEQYEEQFYAITRCDQTESAS